MECHRKYSVNDVIQYCNALEPIHPMWVEDPTPPENVETMERVSSAPPTCRSARVENLYGLSQFAPLILRQACAGVHIDIPKSGGLFEAKRISDFADLYGIWTAWPQSGERGGHHRQRPCGRIGTQFPRP